MSPPRVLGLHKVLDPHSVLGPHRVLGCRRVLDPHRVLGPRWILGRHSVLGPRRVLGARRVLGPHSVLVGSWIFLRSWVLKEFSVLIGSWVLIRSWVLGPYRVLGPVFPVCRPDVFCEKGLRPATLLKKRLWHRCFPVNFAKCLRTFCFTEHLRWLLLYGLRKLKKKKISKLFLKKMNLMKSLVILNILITKMKYIFLKTKILLLLK